MRFLTAGESHGPALSVIVEGCPAGLSLTEGFINEQLARRQLGAGRGARQRIEQDRAQILSGVRRGETLGSPIAMLVTNRDHANWQETMATGETQGAADRLFTIPRPGHADLAGALKYDRRDCRDILERASARETAARVAAGSVSRRLLEEAGIHIASSVTGVGGIQSPPGETVSACRGLDPEMPMTDPDAARRVREAIRAAAAEGDSLGGSVCVLAEGVPPGLGSHVHWDRRLDAKLGAHFFSIPSVKAVELGAGVQVSGLRGAKTQDPVYYDNQRGFYRETNRAGGVEGGISNGEVIAVTAYLKPLSTLMKPLDSVDIRTKRAAKAQKERSDVCAVPAAAVIGEAVLALCLAEALLEKVGGDSLGEVLRNLEQYRLQVERF